jgi:2-desacetyl-2-hydroxyethyl bacteriochlorophyllide A dehydrogenase
MRSLVCSAPGLLQYHHLKVPELKPHHAIVKIKRIGVCGTDFHAFEGSQPYFNYPRILGHELSGDLIDADHADGFVPGERVTILPYSNCGKCIACNMGKPNCCVRLEVYGVHIDGGMLDYLSVPVHLLVHGNDLSYDELASVEFLSIGAHGIRRAAVVQNEFALVMGAGPIGLGTMLFARNIGARVIAMDVNDLRLQRCKKMLAAEHLINPLKDDTLDRLKEITDGGMPTLVVDATGNQTVINQATQYLAHGGRLVLIGLQKKEIVLNHPEFHKREATMMSSRNALMIDFETTIAFIKQKIIDPAGFITHHAPFESAKNEFEKWLDPSRGVVKAMIDME